VDAEVTLSDTDIELKLLLESIFLKYHYDFRGYSTASLKRRLAHALVSFGCPNLSRLQESVLRDPLIFQQLLQIITVPVSDMFRDPTYFRARREKVVPVLQTYPSLKVWVAGCSTGEEVYSLAILLREEGLLDRTLIYATDINAASLQKAQAGVYDLSLLAKFSEGYLRAGGKASLGLLHGGLWGGRLR
jgi:chemotaxis protein methyltransferase CheR